MIPKINSAHGSDTRNILNRAIEVLNQQGKAIQDLVADGQLTEEQYAELITVINGLIKSGHVDKSDLTSEFKDEIEGFSAQLAQSENQIKEIDAIKADKSYVEGTNLRIDELLIESGDANAEVTDARVSTTKNKTFSTLRNRHEETEGEVLEVKQTLFPAKNEIINGNFENTEGWTGFGSSRSVSDNTMIMTGQGDVNYAMVWQDTSDPWVSGHKIYLRATVKPKNDILTKINLIVRDTSSRSNNNALTLNNPTMDVEYPLTEVYTLPTDHEGNISYAINASYPSSEDALGQTVEIEKVLMINLTKTFGAGSEPTKESMDKFMNKFPNKWFDGTKSILNLKEMFEAQKTLKYVDDKAITGDKLGDKEISADKLDFIVESTNLYNHNTVTRNTIVDTSGNIVSSGSGNGLSDFISVTPNGIYSLDGVLAKAFYDKDKVFINRTDGSGTFTIPSNAHYIRLIVYNSRLESAQLNVGNTLLEYEPFYKRIPTNMLPMEIEDIGANHKDYYFAPEEIVGLYKVADDSYSRFNTLESYQDALTSLATEYPEYITEIFKGLDASETYPIYQYNLKPIGVETENLTKKLPKIIIVGGLHGGEITSVFNMYYLMRDLCKHWHTDSVLEYLRWNVELIFIPQANPYAFVHADTNARLNANGVDLNRNFSENWTGGAAYGEMTYGGEAPFSEPETQYIKDAIDENKDAIYFGDYHTNNSSGYVYDTLMWHSLMYGDYYAEEVDIAAKYIIEKMTREFIKDYNQPNNEGFFGYISYTNVNGSSKAYAKSQGILASSTFECFRKFPNDELYYLDDTIKASTEYLGNWLLVILRTFKNRY